MSHSQYDVDFSSSDLATILPDMKRLLDHKTVPPNETQDQMIGTTSRSLKEHLEHAAYHSEQDISLSIDQLHGFLQRPAELRSPVTRLPPEILAHIFELYVRNRIKSTFNYTSSQGPYRLTQVCKHWRDIAESDPCLWTSIHLYFPESHSSREGDMQRVKSVFDLHLNRSGALPISLTFADHRPHHPITDKLVSLLADGLRKHGPRWKQISLRLSCAYFPVLFTFTPCDLPSLECLYISGDVVLQRVVTPLRLNLKSARNLKSFTYSGHGRLADDQIDLYWEGLEEVSFEYTPHSGQSSTLARQFRHLTQCHNITTFSLGIDQPFWRNPNGSQAIILPCLRTLRVRRLSVYSQARVGIDPLILPQLETLEIDASVLVHWNQRWHDRTFSTLLVRSACSLRRLSIQDVDFPNDELVRCLRLSPALTSFRFIPCPRSQNISDLIRQLDTSSINIGDQAWGNGQGPVVDGPFVPQLREITLASSVDGYLGLMIEMLRSRSGARARAAGVATLRRAEVVYFDMWHETDVDRISLPCTRSQRVADVQADLELWVFENKGESGPENEDTLEASVVVDTPYLPEYV